MEEINLKQLTPDVRKLNELESVIYDKEWFKKSENQDAYYMYRGVKNNENLRYDITIIPPQMLGKEFIKTKGHFHSSGHPEFYTVLEGEALFLMQKKDNSDVYAVKALPGESIIIAGDYGHVTINPSKEKILKMANWISKDCIADYTEINNNNGACWLYLTEGWIKNPKYIQVPELRFEESLKESPSNFDFLNETTN